MRNAEDIKNSIDESIQKLEALIQKKVLKIHEFNQLYIKTMSNLQILSTFLISKNQPDQEIKKNDETTSLLQASKSINLKKEQASNLLDLQKKIEPLLEKAKILVDIINQQSQKELQLEDKKNQNDELKITIESGKNVINLLPDDILKLILSYLSSRQQLLARTDKRFLNIVNQLFNQSAPLVIKNSKIGTILINVKPNSVNKNNLKENTDQMLQLVVEALGNQVKKQVHEEILVNNNSKIINIACLFFVIGMVIMVSIVTLLFYEAIRPENAKTSSYYAYSAFALIILCCLCGGGAAFKVGQSISEKVVGKTATNESDNAKVKVTQELNQLQNHYTFFPISQLIAMEELKKTTLKTHESVVDSRAPTQTGEETSAKKIK